MPVGYTLTISKVIKYIITPTTLADTRCYDRQPWFTIWALGHLGNFPSALGALAWGIWALFWDTYDTLVGHLGQLKHSSRALGAPALGIWDNILRHVLINLFFKLQIRHLGPLRQQKQFCHCGLEELVLVQFITPYTCYKYKVTSGGLQGGS